MRRLPNGNWRVEWDASPPKYIDWERPMYTLTILPLIPDAPYADIRRRVLVGMAIGALAGAVVSVAIVRALT